MLGLMQDRPLALPHVFHRAEQYFGHKTIVTAGETTTTIGQMCARVRRLATVLDTLGISADGRVGTFCWNTGRHLELYLAAPCTGRVLHTLNIRLFPNSSSTSPTTPRTRSCSSTGRCCRCCGRWWTGWTPSARTW